MQSSRSEVWYLIYASRSMSTNCEFVQDGGSSFAAQVDQNST